MRRPEALQSLCIFRTGPPSMQVSVSQLRTRLASELQDASTDKGMVEILGYMGKGQDTRRPHLPALENQDELSAEPFRWMCWVGALGGMIMLSGRSIFPFTDQLHPQSPRSCFAILARKHIPGSETLCPMLPRRHQPPHAELLVVPHSKRRPAKDY
jgi:hypothetical protein